MNCLLHISSATVLSRNSRVTLSSLYGNFGTALRGRPHYGFFNTIGLASISIESRHRCFSTQKSRASRLPKVKPKKSMTGDSNAFYVVRKGDVVGVFKSLSDCHAQLVCDPSVSVYKGHSLHKETEKYLAARGLKDALYTMHASELTEDLFGSLVPCPFQQPDVFSTSADKAKKKPTAKKRSQETGAIGSASKLPKLEDAIMAQPVSSRYMTCILEFDGAAKGNPGKAGAGAILRNADGGVVARLREGLGIATNNVAEYRALILGMKYAIKKGYKQIQVQGDSKLICMQVQGLWQTKSQNMAMWCNEVKRLQKMFLSFKINHVLREFNSAAANEANQAINLRDGEVYEESADLC